jgi:flagellar hook assembly protein FlgD
MIFRPLGYDGRHRQGNLTQTLYHSTTSPPHPFTTPSRHSSTSTTISYSLPEAGQVKLEIFNLRGQLVQVLTDSQESAGEHRKVWNGTDQSGNAVASGVYFYRLNTPARSICRRMLLMK